MSLWAKIQLLLGLNRVYESAVTEAKKDPSMTAKSILASKTFWFNIIAGAGAFAQSQGLFTLIPDPWGPPVIALINILLRYITTQPVALMASSTPL
jgi:hypothetical protein